MQNVGFAWVTNPSASFSRPADTTAYASGDLVANSTTAGSVTPMSFNMARYEGKSFMLRRCKLKKSGTSTTSASFRVHLYTSSPTCANGDNGAWSTTESGYVGAFDVTVDRAFTDGAVGFGVPVIGSEMAVQPGASALVLYGLIEARAAYTPASGETFTVSFDDWQN